MRKFKIRCLLAVFILSGVWTQIGGATELQSSFSNRYQQQRQSYIELRQLIADHDLAAVALRRSEIDDYPLAYYLDYLLLRKRIELADKPVKLLRRVDDFYENHQDARLRRRLLSVLKNRTANLRQWVDYLVVAGQKNIADHPCDDLLSRVKTGRIKTFDKAIAELWANPSKHTSSCDEAFPALIARSGNVPTRALWQRTVALVIRNQLDDARLLLRYFNRRDRKTIESWINGVDSPAELLQSAGVGGASEHHRRIAKFLLRKWGRQDLPAASRYWARHGSNFGFGKKEVAAQVSKYAVLAAKLSMPEAPELLKSAPSDRDVRYWRVRMALRIQNWQMVLDQLDELTEKEGRSPRWQYWRARALSELGFRAAAKKIYLALAENFNYYGFLSADRIAAPYSIREAEPLVEENAIEYLRNSIQIQRAIEFFLVNTGWEGRRLWNQALQDATEPQLVAAATLASSLNWHDRGYAAIKLAKKDNALATLFPTPYENLVDTLSSGYSVPKELVYGVMRQESSFIPDIKSSAGAIGLMQLMPATAKEVGKKLGINVPRWKLTDSELNIRLGVKYLELVLHRFGRNPVLAAAAYNAGPHRVNQWQVDTVLPADIWVETIPFDETRDYVKSVLFNTTVSGWRIGNGTLTRLIARMPDVSPLG
ncbi:hypothetical protein AB833_11265 [Chromatiales bacterium (ex Bugula neritina AB1)]|nr:hypothetical protein AB833_11265 [Chromatiales bacterium (ex Bugula neritina AB1)]